MLNKILFRLGCLCMILGTMSVVLGSITPYDRLGDLGFISVGLSVFLLMFYIYIVERDNLKCETKFEKVSFDIFCNELLSRFTNLSEEDAKYIYDNVIVLPKRGSSGSAGYDFITPVAFNLLPGQSVVFPTGIRCKMKEDQVLMMFPRSGLGFKYRTQLDNTVGIIDSDYYNSYNEGHIMVKLTNDNKEGKELSVNGGEKVCQGVILNYCLVDNDDADGIRNGGFGSTGK